MTAAAPVVRSDVSPSSRFDRTCTIHSCFARVAHDYADRPAILFGETGVITFVELERAANRFARQLVAQGVGKGSIVSLYLPRSPQAVVAMLAALKAGAAFAPLDPAWPADHLAFVAADAAPAVVVTAPVLQPLEGAPSWPAPTLALDLAQEGDAAPLAEAADGDCPAYVMYTSGTTGRPKGVVVPHRGVTRLAFNSFVDLGPQDVVLQFAPLAFDASTFEIWNALLNGAAVAIVEAEHPSFAELGAAISRFGVTTAWLTASLFHAIVDRQIGILAPLRQLIAGGDVLSPRHIRRALDALPQCRIVNGYGPTENTTFTCCYEIPHGFSGEAAVPVGRPIAHTTVYVLDADQRPVAPGAEGELFAGGEGVALSYLNRPELSAEKFVADPFCGEAGRLMYRTGDLVRQRADGVVEFVGRVDRQVKIRGKRVEMDEVEALTRRLPDVADGCAIVRERTDGERQIVAYVTPREGGALEAEALRRSMLEIAPDYMVPAHFVILAELPRTGNGKVDRAALPKFEAQGSAQESAQGSAQESAQQSAGAPAPASGDSVETRLAALWSAILKLDHISLDANFFDLGGASLDVMAVQQEIRKEFGLDAPMTALFQHTTVRSLAAHLKTLYAPAAEAERDRQALGGLAQRKLRQGEALKRASLRRAAQAS